MTLEVCIFFLVSIQLPHVHWLLLFVCVDGLGLFALALGLRFSFCFLIQFFFALPDIKCQEVFLYFSILLKSP